MGCNVLLWSGRTLPWGWAWRCVHFTYGWWSTVCWRCGIRPRCCCAERRLDHDYQRRISPYMDLWGGKVDLISASIIHCPWGEFAVCARVLLSDFRLDWEKPVRAAWFLHQVVGEQKAGISRVLISCSESLVHQVVVEVLRKIQLMVQYFYEKRCRFSLHLFKWQRPEKDNIKLLSELNRIICRRDRIQPPKEPLR